MIEGSRVTGYEAAKLVNSLIDQIMNRKDDNFSSFQFQQELDEVEVPFTDTIREKVGKKSACKEILVDKSYLQEMFHRFYGDY